jgi:hypothetical protein
MNCKKKKKKKNNNVNIINLSFSYLFMVSFMILCYIITDIRILFFNNLFNILTVN